jgi:hypothetical protein
MQGGANIPHEIENQFLNNLVAFAVNYKNAEYTTVY